MTYEENTALMLRAHSEGYSAENYIRHALMRALETTPNPIQLTFRR